MPVQRGRDVRGPYYRWGATGARYHYTANNTSSRTRAKNKASVQGRAVAASKRRSTGGRRTTGGRSTIGGRGTTSSPWITRPGKLGGPGYLKKSAAERHRLLSACVDQYGYRSCLDSVMVLNRNREVAALHGVKIDADKNYLKRKYGGRAKSASLSSKPRAQKKTGASGRARASAVASYRKPAAHRSPKRAAAKKAGPKKAGPKRPSPKR